MPIQRIFTEAGRDPVTLPMLRVHQTPDGDEYRVPRHWHAAAVDVLIEQVFFKSPLPRTIEKQEIAGIPVFLCPAKPADSTGSDVYEKDIRDVLKRIAGSLALKAFQNGIISGEKDVAAFYDECRYALFHQILSPEITLWQNTGIDWAYGLTAPEITPQENIARFGHVEQNVKPTSVFVPENIAQTNMQDRLRHMVEGFRLDGHDAAVSVMLPIENVDSRSIMTAARKKESRDLAAAMGTRTLRQMMNRVIDACDRDSVMGFDPQFQPRLSAIILDAQQLGVPMEAVDLALAYARQGYESLPEDVFADIDPFDTSDNGAFRTVLSIPDDFIETALTGHGFMMMDAGQERYHADAPQLWDSIADTIWTSGEPALFFRDTAGHGGRSATGAFMSGQDTQALSGSINLLNLSAEDQGLIDAQKTEQAIYLLMILLDAAGGRHAMAIGQVGLATLLMEKGLAYDSAAGRSAAALIASFMSGAAHFYSAQWAQNEETDLVALKSRRAAASGGTMGAKGIPRRNLQGNPAQAEDRALQSLAVSLWDKAYLAAKEKGLRHRHLTGFGTSLDLQALLGAPTRNIMPEHKLVRFEGFHAQRQDQDDGAFFGKKINPAVPRALAALGYTPAQIDDIVTYAAGHGTLFDAPAINHDTLTEKGFTPELLMRTEAALKNAAHIGFVFNRWTLSGAMDAFMDDEDSDEDVLTALGFTQDEIDAANIHACGTMTLEGAPHLKPQHLDVFDGAEPVGDRSVRRVSAEAQIRMQAAVEPFLSGGAEHIVALPHSVAIDDIKKLMLTAWETGAKQLRLYRDGSSLLSPLAMPLTAPIVDDEENAEEENFYHRRNMP